MSQLTINLDALRHNIEQINLWMDRHGAHWTLVTKVLCGHADSLRALQQLGVRSMGDSRLENLHAIERVIDSFEAWYLRLPHLTAVHEIVAASDVSLNSEIEIIQQLNEEARRQNKVHRVIIMIELGDLREGILPGHLVQFYQDIFGLDHIEALGIGANLGCMSGTVPSIDQMMQLALYRELLELKFERPLPMISAGSTIMIPMLLAGQVPKEINHFRIGEAVFLGTDLINGDTLPGLRNDAMILNAEIVEIKEKSLTPLVETSASIRPFESFEGEDAEIPGQRGYRALVAVGQLDTDVAGLSPVNSTFKISGASSDLTVVNIGEDRAGLNIGDQISFHVNYSALLRIMSSKYVTKAVTPKLSSFPEPDSAPLPSEVPPVLESEE
ncbi:alanine racemase [bacterium]|nr:alanine racemase [bacterium]